MSNRRSYTSSYNKEKYKGYAFRLDKESDADMIRHLSTIDSFTEYMRGLIRRDMISRAKRGGRTPAKVVHSDAKVNISKYPFELIYKYTSIGYVDDPASALTMMENYLKMHPDYDVKDFRICERRRTDKGEIYAYEIK